MKHQCDFQSFWILWLSKGHCSKTAKWRIVVQFIASPLALFITIKYPRGTCLFHSLHYGTKLGHLETSKIHFPRSEGVSKVSKRVNEWVVQANEWANGQASGPVLTSLFSFVPDHSALVTDGWTHWESRTWKEKEIKKICSIFLFNSEDNENKWKPRGTMEADSHCGWLSTVGQNNQEYRFK